MTRLLPAAMALWLALTSYSAARAQPAAGANLDVSAFNGATVDARIAGCIAALPITGGVCDARSLPSAGVINGFSIRRSGVTILGPCGTFRVTGSIEFRGVTGDTWRGCNLAVDANLGTALVWAGDRAAPLLRIVGSRQSEIADLNIKASSKAPLATAIQQETTDDQTSTDNAYHDLYINGVDGGVGKGLRVCAGADCGGSGPDANNDVGRVSRVSVSNYAIAAFSLEHSQAKAWLFEHDNCNGNGHGRYCITTALGPKGQGGSFNAISMAGSGNTGADFFLGAPNDPINVLGGNFEGSNRLLQTAGNSSGSWPVTVTGVRWSASGLDADSKAVIYTHRGGFNFIGNAITAPAPGRRPRIYLDPTGPDVGATAIGNSIAWSGPTPPTSQPFTGTVAGAWRLSGNRLVGAPSFLLPDQIGGLGNPTRAALVADAGTVPGRTLTYSGSCELTGGVGGIMAGSFLAKRGCAGGTYVLTTSVANIPNGLACSAWNLTSPARTVSERAYTPRSVTFTAVAAAGERIVYACTGF